MLICGIDPGIGRCGYALVELTDGNVKVLSYGCLETPSLLSTAERLYVLHQRLQEVLACGAEVLALEALFFNKNARTAVNVAQARGVVLLAAAERGIPVAEYTPPEVKQAVVGYGRAEKRQVQEMLRRSFGLPDLPKPDDAADALAVALCHAQVARFTERTRQGGEKPV
ncbi:MAG: crossover junction endodeoxyribonuclease RuvC [Bacillota bacterium]|jgi:crossover junction endodeoxyribonuclease RuvC|nr:crossover junction endodeoxyribonuclease RuvC [Bacillota bacterium]MDK2925707.1 crossover junction endodeoxyribonuclease RuvC [Bacillota bacterium]MDK2959998.1 crossover junction endodeoxyribonuclease RuvC [Bacillota bacterium]